MRKQIIITRIIVLTLTPVVWWSAGTLPIHSSQSAQAATDANRAKPNDQPASTAVGNGKIAFNNYWNGNFEIFTMNADGSDLKQLTFGGGSGARWSPDGTKIALGSYGQICVMDADGSNQKCLAASGGDLKSSAWSPDSKQIAFVTFKSISLAPPYGSGVIFQEDIYAMNADGSDQRKLTNSDLNEVVSSPAWSPDGMNISFSRSKGNTHTVRVMNADGSNQRDILNGYSYPEAWSPDGSKLLVRPSGMNGIWVVNPDGGGLTKLHETIPSPAYPNVYDKQPVWSPDGSKLAFSTLFCNRTACLDDSGYTVIIVAKADGSHPTTVGGDSFVNQLNWSPDGTKIIFDGFYNRGLFVAKADGTGVTNIAKGIAGIAEFDPSGSGGFYASWQAVPIRPSAIDDTQFFVRQHYRDFLNREPDTSGLNFWMNQITQCGTGVGCVEAMRVNTSASFFLSIEFQESGYLVYRFHKSAFGNLPGTPVPVRFSDFVADDQQLGQGLIVNQAGWQTVLENNKQAYVNAFVQRSQFTTAFPASTSPTTFVDTLFSNAGVTPASADRTAAINEFGGASSTADVAARARALRRVAENSTLASQEFNRAFVLMQYFGYLRRNPNDAPDGNFDGYNFWLSKLNQFNGNYIQAEMVKAFLSSIEYRRRFGP